MSEAIVIGGFLLMGMVAELFGSRCAHSSVKRWLLRHIVPCLCFFGIAATVLFVVARLVVQGM